ncbi:hypothetical protein FACS1894145_1240 [Bacteroidia bacterium]|nr:hypothetical protein FACS1894145_1240 [Bacteroidia bacterium]
MEAIKIQHPTKDFHRPYLRSAEGRVTGYYTPDGVLHECPEGYLTGEEFVKKGIENIEKFCKERGLL